MIQYAETELVKFSEVRVGTQLANAPSIKLYENLGFRFLEGHYVFHLHAQSR